MAAAEDDVPEGPPGGLPLAEAAGDRLRRLVDQTYWAKLIADIVARCEVAAVAGQVEVDIPLAALKLDPDRLRHGHPTRAEIEKRLKAERLVYSITWYHPDCSYCENCSSNCRPKSICVTLDAKPPGPVVQ